MYPPRIDKKKRKAHIVELRNMESDDFDDDSYPVPKKSVVDTLLKILKGVERAPENYFSNMHKYKYGAQGSDVAKAMCEFKYPENRRAEVEEFALNMLSTSEAFFKSIIDLIFSKVETLLVPKSPTFRDNTDGSLEPSDVNRQQRASAVSLLCVLWRNGMIATDKKLEEMVRPFAKESCTILRQVISQYSSIPPPPSTLLDAKRINLSAFTFNGAYHPIYFTSAFLHAFLYQTIEDGLGIIPIHGEITNDNIDTPCTLDKHTPLLVSRDDRNSLIHHIAMIFQLDSSHKALANVPTEPFLPREDLSLLSQEILSCLDYMVKLYRIECKIYTLFKETFSILSQEYGALSKESFSDGEFAWNNHLQICNKYLSDILNTLGLNILVPVVLNKFTTSTRSNKLFITGAFDLCPDERELYVSLFNFDSKNLAKVYTNEITETEALRKYPFSLTQSYRILEEKYKEDVVSVCELLGKDIQKAIDNIFQQYHDSKLNLSNAEKLHHLLLDPRRTNRTGINARDASLLLQSIKNLTEEHIILILFAKFLNPEDTISIAKINDLFKQVFCRRFSMPESCCHYYVHLYACLCINNIIPITGQLQTCSEEYSLDPAHILCQNYLIRILVNEDRGIERDDATFHLIRCVKHLSCFNLLKAKDLVSCMTKTATRLSRVEYISCKTKRLIMTLYNIIYHNYYFWYSSCPEICINVQKIHSIICNVVNSKASKEIADWYEILITVKYKPLLAYVANYVQEQQESKANIPNIGRIHEEYSNSVYSYISTNTSRFTHSLAYQWLKKRLISFLKEIRHKYSKQLDSAFPQYITSLVTKLSNSSKNTHITTSSSDFECGDSIPSQSKDLSTSTYITKDDILQELRSSIIAHFSPDIEYLLREFTTKTLSLLNFTDLSHSSNPADLLPSGFYDRIHKEIKEKYDKHNRFHYIENDCSMYNDRLLPPAPTPYELATVFLSLDVLSCDTVKPLAALIAYMHHSDSRNLQLGAKRILAVLLDGLESAISIDNEQQASVTGLLLVELVKVNIIDYSAISNIVLAYILPKSCICRLTPKSIASHSTQLNSLMTKLDKELVPLDQESLMHENLYINQQKEYSHIFGKYKFLSLEKQLGYQIHCQHTSSIKSRASNLFALAIQMISSFLRHFVIGIIAQVMGIPGCPAIKVPFTLRDEMLKDYISVCLYSQCRQCEITALLSNILDETANYANTLIDAKKLMPMHVNLDIFSETIICTSKLVLAQDFSYTHSLKHVCELIERCLLMTPSVK